MILFGGNKLQSCVSNTSALYVLTMEFLWFWILGCLLAFLAAVGNGLVSYVIITKPRLHSSANWFVLSLAVADFCVALTFVPFIFICDPNDIYCHYGVMFYILWCCFGASIANLCVMVADRYISIVWSLRYNDLMTTKLVVLLISTAWLFPLVLILIPLSWDNSSKKEVKEYAWKVYLLVYTFIMVVLPCFFLLLATGHMIYTARRLSRQRMVLVAQLNFNRPQDSTAVITVNREAKMKSSVKIVVAVVVCFVVCYSLDSYLWFCDVFQKCELSTYLYLVVLLMTVSNSALNPIAYSIVKGDIKSELRRLFCHHVDPQILP